MQEDDTKIMRYQHLLVGIGYLAIAMVLPYVIFVIIGAIHLSKQVLWYLIPLGILGCMALYFKRKINDLTRKIIKK